MTIQKPTFSVIARAILSTVFGAAAIAKASAFSQLQSSLILSRLVPVNMTAAVGVIVIAVEVFICAGLWFPVVRQVAIRTAMVTVCFFISYSFWRGYAHIPVPCTCFGVWLKMAPYQSIILNMCLLGLIVTILRGVGAVSPQMRNGASYAPTGS